MRKTKLTLPDQIQAGLDAAGWTQTDLADVLGTTQSNISAYLLGKREPLWSTVCRIAEALEIVITTGDGRKT